MLKNVNKILILSVCLHSLTGCAHSNVMTQDITTEPKPAATTEVSIGNSAYTWQRLQHTSITKLNSELATTTDPEQTAWIRLALISKQYSNNTVTLTQQLKEWRKANPNHPGNAFVPDETTLNNLNNHLAPAHIALLLPMQGQYGSQGQSIRDGFLSAYYAANTKQHTEQTVAFYDTSEHSDIAALYQKAVQDGADVVIGPLTKTDVQSLLQQNNFPAPLLTLNYSDNASLPHEVYQFGLSSKDEALQIAETAKEAGLSNAIIIAAQDEWGQRTAATLIAQWTALGGHVVDTYNFNSNANFTQDIANLMHVNPKADRIKMHEDNNKEILAEQRRQDFDVIFMLAQAPSARVIVPLLNYYYASNVPIYATSAVYTGIPTPHKDSDLNGVNFCDIPWIIHDSGAHLAKNVRYNRFYAVGRDAYLISNQLPRLNQLPNFPIYASTGALTLTQSQQIYRHLPWTTIHDGRI